MSTSLLHHAYSLKGVTYNCTKYSNGKIIFQAELKRNEYRCPECHSKDVIFKGRKRRQFLLVPCGKKTVLLDLLMHRLLCQRCGKVRWPYLAFAPGKQRYTNSFALFVITLLQHMTIKSVSSLLGVSWDLVKQIHEKKLKSLYAYIDLRQVRYIAIDEFSIKKGHVYMSIIIDMETGRILHAVEGRRKEDIAPFFKKLAKKADKLQAIAMDMSHSYTAAALEYLPHVDIVFDRFHVSAQVNQALDTLYRRQLHHLAKSGQKTSGGGRFVLFRNYTELDPHRKARLDALLEVNRPLFIMHSMKEQLRLFWQLPTLNSARRFLTLWSKDAYESGIKELKKMSKMIAARQTQLLNYFKYRLTCGKIEGLINKIKTLKRQTYGFRDMLYFKLRLYHIHVQRYSLSG